MRGRQTRSMRCRFMALSACLRLGALLVVLVVVGGWVACPSLSLRRRSCIMAPIRFTLAHSGMSSLCVLSACVHIHTCRHEVCDRVVVKQSGCTVACYSFVCVSGRE